MPFYFNGLNLSDIMYINNSSYLEYFGGSGMSVGAASKFENINQTVTENVGYKITGTDISTYSIAAYTEAVGGGSINAVPSWCKSIRAVLMGGGGHGSNQQTQIPDQQSDVDQQFNHNSGYNGANHFQHDQINQQHVHNAYPVGSGGGGGGAFIYISNLQVQGLQQFQVQAGSAAENTSLTLIRNGVNIQAKCNTGDQTQAGAAYRAGGAGTSQYTDGYNIEGWSGQNGQAYNNNVVAGGVGGAVNSTTHAQTGNVYGNGGRGGDLTNAAGGTVGNQGYFRVYYLTS